MKIEIGLFIACIFIFLSACSAGSPDDSYCRAVLSSSPVREVSVSNIYVYGNLHHGTILIAPSCVQPVFRISSFQDEPSEGGRGDRIRHFNQVVYNTPIKGSGVFAIKGLLDVYPGENFSVLVDVTEFRELGEEEGRLVIRTLRESRR
ncbi:hypothetical protein ABE493_16575 [Stenotrophomonas terrae]|uniref:hypothetical protein n=1 Tax=Stenotrophomonas terrae TaxID=405446 RepID=UPI003207C2E1